MTVAELIAKLRTFPKDAEVVLPMEEDFEVARYAGLHAAWQRIGGGSRYAGAVKLRFEWETDEDLEDGIREKSFTSRREVVFLSTREKPEVR